MDQAARQYHQAFERARTKYERKHRDSIGRALFLTVNDFLQAVKERAITIDQAQELVEAEIKPQYIEIAYENLYRDVAVHFAISTQRAIEARSKKAVEPTSFISWVSNFVKTKGVLRITGIVDNIKRDVGSVLSSAVKAGLSIANTVQLFEERRIGYEPYRAARIARTEIISASNYGSQEGAKATGLQLRKEWISTQSIRTRTIPRDGFDHLEMDGKTVLFEEKFKVPKRSGGFEEMNLPGDHDGSAANVINCRCAIAWIPVEEF
jgi:hypothetical protein